MSEPIIFNDVDFQSSDLDSSRLLKYKGQPFTGKLLITGGDNKVNETIDYENGQAHGHDLVFYPDGRPSADKIYDHGSCVSQKEWYNDGKPKKEYDSHIDHLWGSDGVLAKDNSRWLYKNGQPIEEQLNQHTMFFSPAGDLAVKQVYTTLGNGRFCNVLYYYDHVLSRCFEDLFTNYYPELDEHFSRHRLLPDWLNAVYQEDRELGHRLMDRLINHPTPQTRETASKLKNSALKQESSKNRMSELYPPQPDYIIVKLNFDTRL